MHSAAEMGHLEVVEKLLGAGAALEAVAKVRLHLHQQRFLHVHDGSASRGSTIR
jgi:hypothetical protein